MAARYMLDSDICIAFQRGRLRTVVDRLMRLTAGEALLSLFTYGELRLGVEKSRDGARALELLQVVTRIFPVATPSLDVADAYASIRAHLEKRGEVIGSNDLWIAAHARTEGLVLITGNEREFRRVPGLSVENWAAEASA